MKYSIAIDLGWFPSWNFLWNTLLLFLIISSSRKSPNPRMGPNFFFVTAPIYSYSSAGIPLFVLSCLSVLNKQGGLMSESEKGSFICSISAINSSFRGPSTLKPTPSLEVTRK